MSLQEFLPYLSIGLILFTQLSGMVIEGANTFISASELILQVKRPLFVYLWQTVWRNFLMLAHSFVILIIVILLMGLYPAPVDLLAIPGLSIYFINGTWMAAIAAILSTRYRDVPIAINNIFMIVTWLTPIYYRIDQMKGVFKTALYFNPFFHILELVRSPLLHIPPTPANWLISVATAIVGWGILILIFARTRSRIPYWL